MAKPLSPQAAKMLLAPYQTLAEMLGLPSGVGTVASYALPSGEVPYAFGAGKWAPVAAERMKIIKMIQRGMSDKEIGGLFPVTPKLMQTLRKEADSPLSGLGPEVLEAMRARVEAGMPFEAFQVQFPAASRDLYETLGKLVRGD